MTADRMDRLTKDGKRITTQAIKAMHKALVDFGYPLEMVHVEGAIDRLIAGEAPRGGPDKFIEGWLQDAGLLAKVK